MIAGFSENASCILQTCSGFWEHSGYQVLWPPLC